VNAAINKQVLDYNEQGRGLYKGRIVPIMQIKKTYQHFLPFLLMILFI
jgi:hypothetical protein